jgi:hypothetical protein
MMVVNILIPQSGQRKVAGPDPQFGSQWIRNAIFRNIGSFVIEWRRVRPHLKDKIMILHAAPNVAEALRRRFPGRLIFQISNIDKPPFFELSLLVPRNFKREHCCKLSVPKRPVHLFDS